MENKRSAKWDNIKLFLIFCVVMGHSLNQFASGSDMAKRVVFLIYSFHMPAFVFVSGLFSKRAINERKMDRVGSFFVMYFIAAVTTFIAKHISTGTMTFRLADMNNVAWYAFAMAVFMFFAMLFVNVPKQYMIILSLVIACCIGYAKDVGTDYALSRLFTFFPFYIAGFYADRIKIEDFLKSKKVIIASWIVLILVAVFVFVEIDRLYWLLEILRGARPYAKLEHYSKYGIVLRGIWYVVATVMTTAVFAIIPGKEVIVSKLGQRTMQVYILHYVFVLLIYKRLGLANVLKGYSGAAQIGIAAVIAVIITLLLSIKPIKTIVDKCVYFERSKK